MYGPDWAPDSCRGLSAMREEISESAVLQRAPKDHTNIRILQDMISGIPPVLRLGTRQNVTSLCSCGLLGAHYRTAYRTLLPNFGYKALLVGIKVSN